MKSTNPHRKILLLCVLLCLFASLAPVQSSWSGDEETELFLVAQKAFDDGFYDVAIRYIMQFLEKYPQTEKRVQANLLLGQCFFFKEQYLKAFDVFKNLLQYPDYKDATLFWLGETYLKGSDYSQAEKHYRQLIDVYPNSLYVPQAYYSLAWTLFSQQKYADAKDTFLELTKKYPQSDLIEDSLFKIAECEYNLHSYENVVSYLEDYLKKFPQSKRQDHVNFYLGESNYYLEKYSEAIPYYKKTAEVSSDNKTTLASKISTGWCYFKLNDFEHSKQFFDEAQSLSQEKNIPSDDIDFGRASLFSQMQDYPQALEAYNHLISTFPDSPRIIEGHLGKANVLYLLKDYGAAINEYKLVIEKSKQDPSTQELLEKASFGLAWTYLKNGNTEESIKIFKDVVNTTQNKSVKTSALTQIGDAYQDIGELNNALEVYDKILKDFPDSLYADYIQYREGIALLKLNKIEAATLAFQTLQANFPKSKYLTDIKYYLGLAYFKKGDWAAAKEQLAEFLKNLTTTSEFQMDAQYLLGLATFNLQDYAEAMKTFQRLTKNYPDQTSLVSNCEINIAKCLYNLGDAKEAVKKFKIIVYKYPRTDAELESLLWLGDYYLKTSDLKNAVTYYQQLIEYFPGSDKIDTAHYRLGQAFQEQGTLDKAISEYKSIRDSANQELYAKAQLSMADIFSKENDSDVTVDTYRKITTTAPEFSRDAYLKIAETYQNHRDNDNALAAYQEALKSDKGLSKINNAEIQFHIADTYETLNKTNEATESYLKIPYLYPQEAQWAIKAYLRLAQIFEKEEDWQNAKLVYNKIISFGTDEVKFAQERLEWIKNNTTSPTK